MNLSRYKEIRSQSNDPVYICYLIYNEETKLRPLAIQEFTPLFQSWLSTRTAMGILQSCVMLMHYFETTIKE